MDKNRKPNKSHRWYNNLSKYIRRTVILFHTLMEKGFIIPNTAILRWIICFSLFIVLPWSCECPKKRDPVIDSYSKMCNVGLYIVFKDDSTGENLIEKGALSADSIIAYGKNGLRFGIREATGLKGIKIDFLGSDFCNKARDSFYYYGKRSMIYELYLSYMGKYPSDTLLLKTIPVAPICITEIVGISAYEIRRKEANQWKEVPIKRGYCIITK